MALGFFKKKGEEEGKQDSVNIMPKELKEKMDKKEDFVLLDVRDHFEYEICRINGAIEIPLRELAARADELDKSKEIIAYCHTGARSMEALIYLKSAGFKKVKSLKGGISMWAEEIEPGMARY